MNELGLHYGTELVLAELWHAEGITQGQLAERLRVKPPSVTKVLRTLERDGLVARERDPDDARVVRVGLTAKGRRLRRPVERAWQAAEREALGELSARDRTSLRRLLEQALRAV